MGAAGYVRVYSEGKVRARYAELFPENDIDEDWWYLRMCSAELNGVRYIFDYRDDQGQHKGVYEPFWFKAEPGEGGFFDKTRAQMRVLKVLEELGPEAQPEVWT